MSSVPPPSPIQRRSGGTDLKSDARSVFIITRGIFAAYIHGQLKVALAIAVLATVALLILDVPFALILGPAAGVLTLIPVYGAILGALPALYAAYWKVSLHQRPIEYLLWVALVFVALQLLENLLIAPRIQSGKLNLNPFVVLAVVFVSGIFLGPLGPLLAIPVTATARDVRRYVRLRRSHESWQPEEALAAVMSGQAKGRT